MANLNPKLFDHRTLVEVTLRLIDVTRCNTDDELLHLVEGDEFSKQDFERLCGPLQFGSETQAMIAECKERGLKVDTAR